MSATPAVKTSEWATASELGELLDVSRYQVPHVARAAGIRVRKIPGTRPRYHIGDALRVRAESIVEPVKAPA